MKNKRGGVMGGHLKETEALVGLLPPGGILNWNAQNNQSHSHWTDVEGGPRWLRGIIFLSHKETTAVCETHWLFLPSVASICKFHSVDLNETTICAGLWRRFDITMVLIYCQLLIGTTLSFVWPIGSVCCASPKPEAKTLACVSTSRP